MSFIPRSRFGLVRINCTYPSLVAKKVTRKKKVSKKPAEPERRCGVLAELLSYATLVGLLALLAALTRPRQAEQALW